MTCTFSHGIDLLGTFCRAFIFILSMYMQMLHRLTHVVISIPFYVCTGVEISGS